MTDKELKDWDREEMINIHKTMEMNDRYERENGHRLSIPEFFIVVVFVGGTFLMGKLIAFLGRLVE